MVDLGLQPNRVVLAEGHLLRIPGTGPAHDPGRPHDFLVALLHHETAVLVPICKFQAKNDTRYRLEPGDLPPGLLRQASVLLFRDTTVDTRGNVERKIFEGLAVLKGRADVEVIGRAVSGLREQSARLPGRAREALVAIGLMDAGPPRKPTI